MAKEFLTIGEFSRRVGVSAVTLRKWEERGFLKPHHRSYTGYRYYTEEQVAEVLSGDRKAGTTNESV